MMKNTAKYFILILSMIFVQHVMAQDGDAVFNKIVKEYTLNSDGSTEYREYKEIKLLSHMSFHRLYGETFVVFDPGYQEVIINDAFTIMKDGKKVEVPDNAFNEVLPRAASHAAPYNHLRELVITHTGLEVGATIYLDYTIKTNAGYMQTFMGEELIKDIVPINEKKVIIRVPEDQELKYKVLNLRTGAQLSDEKGMKVYTFNFSSLSAYTHVWGYNPEALPRLFFSAAKDLERAYFPFVAQPAFTYQANENMSAAVKKIIEKNDNDLRAALAIQKLVVNDIGTWNLPLEYAGFKCRTPEETWNSNAGTAIEKTLLLATLLQKAGIKAVPVAIIPDKYYDRTIGSLYMFKEFAVQVRYGSEIIYLSATRTSAQDLGFSRQGEKFLVLDGAIESLKTYESEHVLTEVIYTGDFEIDNENSFTGTLNVKLAGGANPYFSLYEDSAYAKRFASGVSNAEINYLSLKESKFDLGIEKKNASEEYGDYFFINIPASSAGVSSWGLEYIETGRNTPIKLKETILEKYQYAISIPEGFELLNTEVDIMHENEIGAVEISIRQEGNKVFFNRKLEIKKQLVKYDEFEAFGLLWDAWMNAANKKLVFKISE